MAIIFISPQCWCYSSFSMLVYAWIKSMACQQPPKRVLRSCSLDIAVWWRPQHWFHWKIWRYLSRSWWSFIHPSSSHDPRCPFSPPFFSFIRAEVSLYENQEEVIGCQLYVGQPSILLVEMVFKISLDCKHWVGGVLNYISLYHSKI